MFIVPAEVLFSPFWVHMALAVLIIIVKDSVEESAGKHWEYKKKWGVYQC